MVRAKSAADANHAWRAYVPDLQQYMDYLATPVMNVEGENAAWNKLAADCQRINSLK